VDESWRFIEEIPASTKRRVIVADGDQYFRSVVAGMLRAEGYAVVEVPNGLDLHARIAASIRRQWRQKPFDLVICDARLVGKTGLDIFADLGNLPTVPPVVFTVTFGDRTAHAQARRLGALAVLEKPVEIDGLQSLVHSIIRHGNA